MTGDLPILEFDPGPDALIDPQRIIAPIEIPQRCVICLFQMEAAALFAVAQFRGVRLAQLLYAGDDLSGDLWDHRGWDSQGSTRERLFWLAVDACLEL